MKTTNLAALTAFLCLAFVSARADDKPDMKPYEGTKEFQQIKALEGHWEGTSSEGMDPKAKPQKITVDYHVTSGGSAVVETLFAGTPHEMVSVYHDDNGQLSMTHYCMMHNQPHMVLAKSADPGLFLVAVPDGNLDMQSCHMHSVKLEMPASDKLVQKWTSYDGGKEKGTSMFAFARSPSAK